MRSLALVVLSLAIGACGDDGVNQLPDAPPQPDAAVDAATSGPVSLRVVFDGQPVADVAVYFQNADSSVVSTTMTDATGTATATMEPGGFVTAVDPFALRQMAALGGTSNDLKTFAGVKPGDELLLSKTSNTAISVTVEIPIDVAASTYTLYTSCSTPQFISAAGSGQSTQVFLYDCGTTIDLAVMAYDGNGLELGAFFHPGVAVTDLAVITLTDSYVAPQDVTAAFTNAPAFSYVGVSNTIVTTNGPLVETFAGTDLTAGAGTVAFKRPVVAGGLSVFQSSPSPNSFGQPTVVDWGAASAATFALDLGAVLLSPYTSDPTFDVAAHEVSWTQGTGVAADFVVTDLSANRTAAFWQWTMVSPVTGAAATLPVLPGAAAQFNVLATDTVAVDGLTTAKVPGGYDAVRETVLGSQGPLEFAIGASGQIVFQSLAGRKVARPASSRPFRPTWTRQR